MLKGTPTSLAEIREKKDVQRKVYFALLDNIKCYGFDGMGDKPKDMDVVEYWLSQIDPDDFNMY
jgi:hypothetical protein